MTAFVLLLAGLLAEPKQYQLNTLDGQTAVGTLAELTDKQVVIQAADGAKTFKFTEVRTIRPADQASGRPPSRGYGDPSKQPAVWMETTDGSRLPGVGYSVKKGAAELKLSGGETLSLPTNGIRLVDFPAADGSPSTWIGELKPDQAADLIVVRKRDGMDYVEGSAGDVTDETVNFNVDGDNVPVKRAKVAGIVYFHAAEAAPLPEPNCVFEDTAGQRVMAKRVALDGGELKIVTAFGGSLARPLDSLKLLDFSAGRMTYLSDLPTVSSDWTPLVDFGKQATAVKKFYAPQKDRGMDGGPLRVAGKSYPKGLAIPSRTAIVYKVTGKGKRFKAIAGIDDSVHDAGEVHLVVSGDGKALYDGKIIGRKTPVELDLDVAGVKRLNILVDFGEGLDVGNYLDLCDARIVK